jgi:hypothetical protein
MFFSPNHKKNSLDYTKDSIDETRNNPIHMKNSPADMKNSANHKENSPLKIIISPDRTLPIPVLRGTSSQENICKDQKEKKMQKLNMEVQEAKALLKTALRYGQDKSPDGLPQSVVQSLSAAIDAAVSADVAHQNATRDAERATSLQDQLMEKAFGLVRKLRAAAKACFGDDDTQAMRDFHVGKILNSVKNMVAELAYLKTAVTKCDGSLSGFGVKDIAALDTTAAELSDADQTQENAVNLRKAARDRRDKALSALLASVRRVQNAARSLFGDNKSIMTEFGLIAKARAARKPKPATKA